MDSDLELQRSRSEPNGLSIFSPDTLKDPFSTASSAASLIHVPSRLPFPNGKLNHCSLSVDHFGTKWQCLKSMNVLRRSQLSLSLNKSSSSSSSSSIDDNGCLQDSDNLQYSRFDDSPSRIESSPSHLYLERMMLTSIPRRKEFSEQFRDLAQLHENSEIPRAKWDDASRLFPKQFGLPPSIAISIW
ncbi:unnamed protein product [Rodentolepis nana]|uniref:Transcription repressor n=1 Tax=Rodentolepis nana TaxID=102285 RepID=A0A0R3TZA8_RODNA|nr:unnamed protein product [Rodentolepis nana]